MGRSLDGKRGRNKDQSESRIRKMSYENSSLKREIARLRKQINQIDSGWCPGCLKAQEQGEPESASAPEQVTIPVNKPGKDWKCFKCEEGKLELQKYYKFEEIWYYRACNCCKNRTRGKRWSPEVPD